MKILIMSTFNWNNNGLSMCDCQCATGLHRGTPLTFELLDSNSLICFVLGLFVGIILGVILTLKMKLYICSTVEKKADVRGKLRKAERSLYGIWTTATNKLATESGTEIKFSCDFDGIRYIEILLKNRCCNWFIIINMSLMYRLIIVNCIRYPV